MKQDMVVITIDLLDYTSSRTSEVWVTPSRRTTGDSQEHSGCNIALCSEGGYFPLE